MKRVSTPVAEPSVLGDFRAQNPQATWDEFKNQLGSEQVFDSLSSSQGTWRTTSQGVLVTSPEGCASAEVDPALAESTLSFLGLNRRVLVRLRAAVLDKLLEDYADIPFDPSVMLLPDGQGRLQPFWSTVREFGGSDSEAFVSENVARIPGLAGSFPK